MSSFRFGGVTAVSKPSMAAVDKYDFVLADTRQSGEDWYLVLTNGVPFVEKPDGTRLKSDGKVVTLKRDLEAKGMRRYIIASVSTVFYADVKAPLEHVKNFVSGWTTFVTGEDKPKAIVAMGAALYAINKSTDVLADHFTPVFVRPYFYSRFGIHVYPTHSFEDVYTGDGEVSWRRKWFRQQVTNALEQERWLPDLRAPVHHVISSDEEAKTLFESLVGSKLLSCDTETDSFDETTGHIGCVTLCADGVNGYFVPWRHVVPNSDALVKTLKSAKKLVGANAKFDTRWMWRNGLDPMGWHFTDDVGQLSHALVPGRPVGLKALAFYYTCFGGYDDELDDAKKNLGLANYLEIPETILSKYAILDAVATWRIFVALSEQCDEVDAKFPNEKQEELRRLTDRPDGKHRWGKNADGMTGEERVGEPWTIRRWYEEVMIPMANDCCDLEYVGLYVDYDEQKKGLAYLSGELDKEKKALSEAWGVPVTFDFLSNKELGNQLLKMDWRVTFSSKNNFQIDDSVIQDYIRENKPGAKNLKRLRAISTQIGTFVGYEKDGVARGWLQYFRYHGEDDTWRIHTQFASMLAETFRHRSANPNFQNLTSGGEFAKHIKRMISSKHTYVYRVKSGTKEYLFPHDARVVTQRGEVLARELKDEDTIVETDDLRQYETK